MDIKLRNEIILNENSCWINESAAQALAYNPSNSTIEIDQNGISKTFQVTEILPDMNFHSLYENTLPTIFFLK